MPLRPRLLHAALAGFVGFTAAASASTANAALSATELEAVADQVKAAETAFAKTMADRKFDAFSDFVADDAVFRGSVLRIGRANIVDAWRAFFAKPAAPFSWAPDAVTVAADGRSAISTGPVRTPDGKMVSRFTSIWRKDADGHWRVIADQGVDACDCPQETK
jgi:ketosteroid isomerase-like protein